MLQLSALLKWDAFNPTFTQIVLIPYTILHDLPLFAPVVASFTINANKDDDIISTINCERKRK